MQTDIWRKMGLKHREFCRLTEQEPELSQGERYLRAGYIGSNAASAATGAAQCLKRVNVSKYLAISAELQTRTHNITKQKIIQDLENIAKLALEKGDFAVARACKTDISKLMDHYPAQKTEQTVRLDGGLPVSEDDIDRMLLAGMDKKHDSTVQH